MSRGSARFSKDNLFLRGPKGPSQGEVCLEGLTR